MKMQNMKLKAGTEARPRDPVLDEYFRMFHLSGVTKTYVTQKSGICSSTLNNWHKGKTRSPLFSTMRKALEALDCTILVVRKK